MVTINVGNWMHKKTVFFENPFSYSFLDIFKNVQNPKPKKTFGKISYRILEKVI
jgi:hypothetical protein